MTPLKQQCRLTGQNFIITDEDQTMLEKLAPSIAGQSYKFPLPTLSPLERQRRRLAIRNDHSLYHRKCDKTGKQIIALYDIDSPYTIYNQELWWSDKWSGQEYGRDFDFSRPFFEQFAELQRVVPRLAINGIGNENCDYTSYAGWSRNCYLTFTSDRNEDCYFGAYTFDSANCMDTLFSFKCELCFECTECYSCYHCQWCFNMENCTDCILSRDCLGCSDCFGCIGLRNKQYCIYNKQYSKEEYFSTLKQFKLGSRSQFDAVQAEVERFHLSFPRKALDLKGSENVSGDHIKFTQNCHHCFDVSGAQDCRYVSHFIHSKDCMDFDYYGDGSELCYEVGSSTELQFSAFVTNSWGKNANLLYCDLMMHGSKNCFGCIGLKKAEYFILNKQYSKEEYEILVPKIIGHMRETEEWGEFFPSWLSPYAYNETVAQDYLPLSEKEVEQRGLKWKDKGGRAAYQGPHVELPDQVQDADLALCKQILTCEVSGENYKIIPQELAFYQRHGLPLPRRSPNQRYLDRMKLRNPRQLWKRACTKCGQTIMSSYAPERQEIVYCDACYNAEIY